MNSSHATQRVSPLPAYLRMQHARHGHRWRRHRLVRRVARKNGGRRTQRGLGGGGEGGGGLSIFPVAAGRFATLLSPTAPGRKEGVLVSISLPPKVKPSRWRIHEAVRGGG